ncbi:MAG: sugar phosphate isomerase/epimerase family protein [Blastocatellia bacterium]
MTNRRDFLSTTAMAAAALTINTMHTEAAVKWPVGCFNRPWTKWSYDETLDGVKAAGYKITGLLSRTRQEQFIGADATPEYLAGLKQKLAARGLVANMGALRVRADLPFEDGRRDLRKQIDNANFLGLQYVLTFGVDKPEEYDNFYRLMSDGAAYAKEKKVKLTMKPHGGASGASSEILAAIKKVGHPNFKIWYDAGNIIHYTDKDPVTELMPVIGHVTGFCAKDCGALRGDVMIQFGAGKVDFGAVFAKLKSAGYKGPVMVECCKIGATPAETTANARANREFLEKALAAV